MKIRVAFMSNGAAYTYNWPDWRKEQQPDIGDIVEVPANWAFPDGGRTATVVGVGSDYDGPLADLVRVVPADEQVDE